MTVLEFSAHTRRTQLDALQSQGVPATFDAVVVGGGVVGTGLARELRIRGLSTLLVEKGDFASGTSSRSSKLIHGGLRYLEMFDFGLVFEALSERHWLLKTMPHLVQPLEFDLPFYTKASSPAGSRPKFLLEAGLWLYDALSLFRTPFFHGKHSADEVKKLFPGLRDEGLKGSLYYADAMMLDDELVLETALDAATRGATLLNYVEAKQISARGTDGFFTVTLQETAESKAFTVKAKQVIACVGPWTEVFGSHVTGGSLKKLKPSKGVHLIFPWEKLPVEHCLVMSSADKRIVFAIPRKDLGTGAEVVIVGTTDSPEHGTLEKVRTEAEDAQYLLRILKSYFPDRNLTVNDVIMTYAGVRPLIDDGAQTEAKTSREHEIWRNSEGVVFMAGGKYTTFRKISQEIADFTFPKTHTKSTDAESKKPLSLPDAYAKRFGGQKIWGRFTDQWILWKLKHHAPCSLEDLVFRRMPLWMAGERITESQLMSVAKIAANYFRWSDTELQLQLQKTRMALSLALDWKKELRENNFTHSSGV